MAGTAQTAIANGRLSKAGGLAVKLTPLWGLFGDTFETEVALRRGIFSPLYRSSERFASHWNAT